MKNVCIITGTRADYGILKPVMSEIKKDKKLKLSIIATGMHLSRQFGYTIKEIEKDGFKINKKIKTVTKKDSLSEMAKSLGYGIIGITEALEQIKPDILMILGDRTEALASAISGAYINIPVAHIHGGDSAASTHIDDSNRHAITKLAHIHFPATKRSAERIIKMGEKPESVFVVGSPSIDSILNEKMYEPEEISKKYGLNLYEPILLVVQHPVSTEIKDNAKHIVETLNALKELKHQTILIYPNADAGGREMIKVIKKYEKYHFIKTFKNISHKEYLSLMKIASVMIGNSSSGIIEAPSFKLPVINIGTRQKERERAENVIDAKYEKKDIIARVEKALYDKVFLKKVKKCKNPYGDGKSSKRIIKILNEMKIDKKILQKKITY